MVVLSFMLVLVCFGLNLIVLVARFDGVFRIWWFSISSCFALIRLVCIWGVVWFDCY